jgi:hypothetical protein
MSGTPMPFAWYTALLLLAGVCALGDLVLRGRFSLRAFAVATALAFAGTLLGWAFGHGLGLPDLLQLRVEGERFPLIWSFVGAATFLGTADFLERRNRRKALALRGVREILSEAGAVRS